MSCYCWQCSAADLTVIIIHENGAFAFALHATRNQLTMLLSRLFRIASLLFISLSHLLICVSILNLNLCFVYLSLCLITIGGPPTDLKVDAEQKQNDQRFIFSYFNSSNFFSHSLSHICLSLKHYHRFGCYTFRLQ